MLEATTHTLRFPSADLAPQASASSPTSLAPRDVLTELLRQGAHRLLAQAVEQEIDDWLEPRKHLVDEQGRRLVVRNGYAAERTVVTGVGPVDVKVPRSRDRREPEQRERFTSKVLPPYLRKAKSIDELIPWLYLKGVSTGGFNEALHALLGPNCPGLSASAVTRLVATWQDEQAAWAKRDLLDKHYVYVWAAPGFAIHFNIRLE